MALTIHRAPRADALVDELGELLAAPLADPFAVEVIAVPSRGVERWLAQRLSHRLGRAADGETGVCAGIRFPSLGALADEVLGQSAGDPWAPDRLVWPLLAVIDESLGQPWCGDLTAHLQSADGDRDDQRRGRRYQVARRLAGLFDSYATYRPSMLDCWGRGQDTDGAGRALPPDLAWQARLWRLVAGRIDQLDPVARRRQALSLLISAPAEVEIPDRVSVFGITRLPDAARTWLGGLAQVRDVHLWLAHPSPSLWGKVAGSPVLRRRRDDTSGEAAVHPLLRTLGRESRELAIVLGVTDTAAGQPTPLITVDGPVGRRGPGSAATAAVAPRTLLTVLQHDIIENQAPSTVAADASVQIHDCYGPSRQIEVLRDVICRLLVDDPTLEPRDIVVLCPDIERYAPLINAAFGLGEELPDGHPAHQLTIRLADRSLRATNPLLDTAATLLELADARVTASQLLDLAGTTPVRRRFRLENDDLGILAGWIEMAGVRWGLDQAHREPFGLHDFPQNTWRSGLDRLLVGVAMAEDAGARLATALPLDDVGSGDVELAGHTAEFVARVQAALDGLRGRQPLGDWLAALAAGVESLTAVPEADTWQVAELDRQLAEVADEAHNPPATGTAADSSAAAPRLELSDVRALLRRRLAGRPTRANFRTGALTFCTMVPMRSVPHRVICLLGLDDGSFPRNQAVDGDDILAVDPMVGERDQRAEDRQLMLDALLAATEHLVITFSGRDERTGAQRPPAVPLAELIDVLEEMTGTDTRLAVDAERSRCDVPARYFFRHPLQPFDDRTLRPGALHPAEPFTFDPAAQRGAQAAAAPRRTPPPFVAKPLPPQPISLIELQDLIVGVERPARTFLRRRIGMAVPREEQEAADALTVDLDGLGRWSIGERLVQALLNGRDLGEARQAEWLRGQLPPGALGQGTLDEVAEQAASLVAAAGPVLGEVAAAIDVEIALPDGRVVTGSVPDVRGACHVGISYATLGPAQMLRAWVRLLALTAGRPEAAWRAALVGRARASTRRLTLGPVDTGQAVALLADLVQLVDLGRRWPLPLPVKTAHAYALARQAGNSVETALTRASATWEGDAKVPGERDQPEHRLVYGAAPSLTAVTRAGADDAADFAAERSCFGQLARRLWVPLFAQQRWTLS